MDEVQVSVNRRLSDQFQLRLPDGMRERLKAVADANERSMNAEIVDRLDQSFNDWPRVSLHPELRSRALLYDPEMREAFERELSQYATDLAAERFPAPETQVMNLYLAVSEFIDRLPSARRGELNQDARVLIGQMIEEMPEEEREEARDSYKLLFGKLPTARD